MPEPTSGLDLALGSRGAERRLVGHAVDQRVVPEELLAGVSVFEQVLVALEQVEVLRVVAPLLRSGDVADRENARELVLELVDRVRRDRHDGKLLGVGDDLRDPCDEFLLLLDLVLGEGAGLRQHPLKLALLLGQLRGADTLQSEAAAVALDDHMTLAAIGVLPDDDVVDRHPPLPNDRRHELVHGIGRIAKVVKDLAADLLIEQLRRVRVSRRLREGEPRVVRVRPQLVKRREDSFLQVSVHRDSVLAVHCDGVFQNNGSGRVPQGGSLTDLTRDASPGDRTAPEQDGAALIPLLAGADRNCRAR